MKRSKRQKPSVQNYDMRERARMRQAMDREKRQVLLACQAKDRRLLQKSSRPTQQQQQQKTIHTKVKEKQTTISANVFAWQIQSLPQFPKHKTHVSNRINTCKRYHQPIPDETIHTIVSEIDAFEKRLGIINFIELSRA